jgi:hypothetical protein
MKPRFAIDDRPWAALPPETADALRPELPQIAAEAIEAISHAVPDYARPLEGPFGEGLRGGVEQAMRRFVDLIGRSDADPESDPERQIYVGLGRGEMRAGRRLDALLAAYRVGARVAWRRMSAAGEGAGLSPRVLYLLAESIFAYIHELSSESVEGYAMGQAAVAGTQQRRRRDLAALLVQDPPVDATAIEAAALDANWSLPNLLAAVYVKDIDPDRLARRLGGGAIAADLAGGACALVPDPDAPGRRRQLDAAFAKRRVGALGPTVRWRDAHVSAGRARSTFALVQEGAIVAPGGGLVVATDHPVELLVNADRRLARDLAASAFAPLADETPASRERLMETLHAWLMHRGRTDAVANALHVHPQTVRYRVARLRELYDDRLDDPDARFELELALRTGVDRQE